MIRWDCKGDVIILEREERTDEAMKEIRIKEIKEEGRGWMELGKEKERKDKRRECDERE